MLNFLHCLLHILILKCRLDFIIISKKIRLATITKYSQAAENYSFLYGSFFQVVHLGMADFFCNYQLLLRKLNFSLVLTYFTDVTTFFSFKKKLFLDDKKIVH